MYFDEVLYLLPNIKHRKAQHYKLLLAIATNPHIQKRGDQRLLWESLDEEIREKSQDEELDRAGLDNLKSMLQRNNSRIAVK